MNNFVKALARYKKAHQEAAAEMLPELLKFSPLQHLQIAEKMYEHGNRARMAQALRNSVLRQWVSSQSGSDVPVQYITSESQALSRSIRFRRPANMHSKATSKALREMAALAVEHNLAPQEWLDQIHKLTQIQ